MAYKYRPLVLAVLDGFGINPKDPKTTWKYAKMENFGRLEKFFPFTALQASGPAVGLPWGEEGNSEVGHLTIGAGRPVYTHLPRITMAINDKSFFENPAFKKAVLNVKERNSKLHVMGLFSSGSVHSFAGHLYALLELARREGVGEFFLHIFTDGRDAPMREAYKLISGLEERLAKEYPGAQIASVVGRRFAMDRDSKWDLIEKTYNLLVLGEGLAFERASLYIEKAYSENITDEFIEPGFLSEAGEPVGRMADGDSVIFFNFREDSARELAAAFSLDGFDKFPRNKINNLVFVSMTQYDPSFPVEAAFLPINVEKPLARVISEAGLKQLHIAETEKYAHVTYFFNGGRELPFEGEDRVLVPSLASARFDESPEMSAKAVTEKVLDSLAKYDFILVNFANADMVGHTGNFEATVKALEVLDDSLGKIFPAVLKSGGALIVTADHGNAEEKLYSLTGEQKTKHTSNPVPFFLVAREFELKSARPDDEIVANYREVKGVLSDIAPTALELMGLVKPDEMTGISLVSRVKI